MVSFPEVSPPKPLYASPLPCMCYMPRPPHSSRFDPRTIFGKQYRSLSSALCSFLHSPGTLSLLGPNILLSTLFSNTLHLHSFLNVSDQVSHPYKTKGKIINHVSLYKGITWTHSLPVSSSAILSPVYQTTKSHVN
jgi:hypothetical protein